MSRARDGAVKPVRRLPGPVALLALALGAASAAAEPAPFVGVGEARFDPGCAVDAALAVVDSGEGAGAATLALWDPEEDCGQLSYNLASAFGSPPVFALAGSWEDGFTGTGGTGTIRIWADGDLVRFAGCALPCALSSSWHYAGAVARGTT